MPTPKIAPEPHKDASAAAAADSPKKDDKPPDPGAKTEGKGGDMSQEQAATKIQTLYRGHYERRVGSPFPDGASRFASCSVIALLDCWT